MKKFIYTTISLLFAATAWCQAPTFTARLDTNYILIGQQTTLQFKATNIAENAQLLWPAWPDTLSGLELLSHTRDTLAQSDNGTMTIVENLRLTSFDSGFVIIPEFTLQVEQELLKTEPKILNVGTVEVVANQDYFDIKGPVDPPFDFWYWFKKLWYVSVILAIALALFFWFWMRKRKEKAQATEVPDLRTPAEKARDTLSEIREKRIWQNGHVKMYYSQVSDAVRLYLEELHHVPAMEMVSDELLDAMDTRISAEAHTVLRHMLKEADMVKFAKAKPGEPQHNKLWEDAQRIIELTEPKEETNAS